MTDLELLFLVLAVIYLWECACWLPRASVALLTWTESRWSLMRPSVMIGNQLGGFVFAHPLPPLGAILSAAQLPVSLSPDYLLAYVSPSPDPGGRPRQTGKILRYEDIKKIEVNGRKIIINGELFLKASSPAAAYWLADKIRQFAKAKPKAREAQIQELFEESFDVKKIERRWENFQSQTKAIRWLTNGAFIYIFVFAPVAIHRFTLAVIWAYLLAGIFTLTFLMAMYFRKVHKTWYLPAEDDRFTHFLTTLLSPVTGIRAHDVLSRPLMHPFHPLAVAKVFGDDGTLQSFARKTLLDIRNPAMPVCPSSDTTFCETERYSRAQLQSALESFLKKSGLDPAKLTEPPVPAEAACRSYCPRCLVQFTTESGQCADCGGIPLVAFASIECLSAKNPKS